MVECNISSVFAVAIENSSSGEPLARVCYLVFSQFRCPSSEGRAGPVAPVLNPLLTSDVFSVNEDSGDNYFNVLINDSPTFEGMESLTITSVGTPSQGGTAEIFAELVRYSPAPNFFGTETFSYTFSDSDGNSQSDTVNVTVESINDNPTAISDTFVVSEDYSTLLDVLANDHISPDTGESLTITAVTQGSQGGTVSIEPGRILRYEPALNYFGTETFTYTISDGNFGFDTATVTMTVIEVSEVSAVPNERMGEVANMLPIFKTIAPVDIKTTSGTLAIEHAEGYTPSENNRFRFLQSTSRTGTFEAITGTDLSDGLLLELDQSLAEALDLVAVSSQSLAEGESQRKEDPDNLELQLLNEYFAELIE